MTERLKVAVIGVGHLGQVHARIYAELPEVELVAVCDADAARAQEIAARHAVRAETDFRTVLGLIDAISVATPTSTHHEIASECLKAGVATLIEKPMATTVSEAEELVALAKRAGVALSVGHVERFNPAFRALGDHVHDAKFIEAHRLAPFAFRSTDIGVVLDLMIHDLDLILAVVPGEVTHIEAAGVNVIHPEHEDLVSARLTFSSGCVANVTASRISDRQMRKIRFFTPDAYITLDLKTKEAWVYKKAEGFADFDPTSVDPKQLADPMFFLFQRVIDVSKVPLDDQEPLRLELADFTDAVRDGRAPTVTGAHGTRAIRLAHDVLDAIGEHRRRYFPDTP